MFANRHATFMLPAKDVERAAAWYKDKLGLEPTRQTDFGVGYRLTGAGEMFLYKSDYAGTAHHTLISFDSPDLVADMAALRAKGVHFIEYDLPSIKTKDGLAEFGSMKNAWARDSEGNIIGFVEGVSA
jgi:catechol 2,3-dioxygenase-like lactoylglutathione lyase family enzyme